MAGIQHTVLQTAMVDSGICTDCLGIVVVVSGSVK